MTALCKYLNITTFICGVMAMWRQRRSFLNEKKNLSVRGFSVCASFINMSLSADFDISTSVSAHIISLALRLNDFALDVYVVFFSYFPFESSLLFPCCRSGQAAVWEGGEEEGAEEAARGRHLDAPWDQPEAAGDRGSKIQGFFSLKVVHIIKTISIQCV